MKSKNLVKIISLALVICLAVCGLSACSSKDIKLTVNNMGESKEINATTGMTVADALTKAEITLGEKDETDPEKSTKITEDLKEITVKRFAEVTVVYGDEKKQVSLVGGTVEDAVKEAGFKISDEIKPDAPLTDYLKDGMTINLVKGIKIKLTVDGKTSEVTTFMATVEAMLKEQKITLSGDDTVKPELSEKIKEDMEVIVSRVTFKEVTETEKISYGTEEKYSDSMEKGSREVSQQGVDGEKTVTYKVKYIDGKEDSREKIKEEVTKEPVKEIVTVGTKTSGGDSGSDDSDSGNNSGNNSDNSSDNGSSGGSGGGSDTDNDSGSSGGRTEVSRQDMPDCDGSGHGYYIVTYSDGSVEYKEY